MSDTVTMTLADFLLARIAEDEDNAADCGGMGACHIPDALVERRSSECEAKRAIVGECAHPAQDLHPQARHLAMRTLRHLALPYADHPSYREEWRP